MLGKGRIIADVEPNRATIGDEVRFVEQSTFVPVWQRSRIRRDRFHSSRESISLTNHLKLAAAIWQSLLPISFVGLAYASTEPIHSTWSCRTISCTIFESGTAVTRCKRVCEHVLRVKLLPETELHFGHVPGERKLGCFDRMWLDCRLHAHATRSVRRARLRNLRFVFGQLSVTGEIEPDIFAFEIGIDVEICSRSNSVI